MHVICALAVIQRSLDHLYPYRIVGWNTKRSSLKVSQIFNLLAIRDGILNVATSYFVFL